MRSLLLLLACLPQEAEVSDPLPAADPAVTAGALEHHLRFLASDELKGRDTGTPELARAARYLARALESYGLEPGGDDGGFLQRVPMARVEYGGVPELEVELADGTLWIARHGVDFRLRVQGLADEARRVEVVVATADDAAPALEEAGELALFLDAGSREGDPWLEEAGMPGGRGLGLLLRKGSRREGKERELGGRASLVVLEDGPDPCDHLQLNGKLLEQVRAGEVAALTLHVESEVERLFDQNVVGILRGAGTKENPDLAQEAIVLSAHFDHVGTRGDGSDGSDVIFNGADDDASGVAGVLELTEALAANGPPARTLVVLLATGEERGLLGTEWYLDHPTVPLEKTLLNLNLEMIGRPDELMPGPGHLWLTGWNETTLGPSLAGDDQPVHEDPRPAQNFYRRSDNYAFVKRGTMGQTLSSYGLHTDYHKVTDEVGTLDFEHMEIATRHALVVAEALLLEGLEVAWSETADRR